MVITFEEQLNFAKLSQDFNPMHCDQVLARRYIYGEIVAHGINVMILAIQYWSKSRSTSFVIKKLKCRFNKPIFLKQKIDFEVFETKHNIRISVTQNKILKIKINLEILGDVCDFIPHIKYDSCTSEIPDRKVLDGLVGYSKKLDCSIDDKIVGKIYSKAFIQKIGLGQLAEIISYTRIIGMHAPGMNSIFSELNILNDKYIIKNDISFRVATVDERFSIIHIDVTGPNFYSVLKAFFRPMLVSQKNIEHIKNYVNETEFKGQRALIVGGSRGLGEFTAKCLGYGGADLMITYARGKEDSVRVVDEIQNYNKKIKMHCLDVCRIENSDLKAISDFNPTHIYYYATPFIFSGIKGQFSEQIYSKFREFYIDSFRTIVEYISENCRNKNIFFLYPSSVALDEEPADMLEYTLAKKKGELLCVSLEKKYQNITISRPRLPRLETDQTVSLSSAKNEDPIKILDIIRSM